MLVSFDILIWAVSSRSKVQHTLTVTDKSYATLIQEFFVVPPEQVEKVWT